MSVVELKFFRHPSCQSLSSLGDETITSSTTISSSSMSSISSSSSSSSSPQDTGVVDARKDRDPCARPSRIITKSNKRGLKDKLSGDGDGDTWVERPCVNRKTGTSRLLFVSTKTGKIRREPPSGASRVMYYDELYHLMEKSEMTKLDDSASDVARTSENTHSTCAATEANATELNDTCIDKTTVDDDNHDDDESITDEEMEDIYIISATTKNNCLSIRG
eukprot:CAMPEP_0203723044 /NCGR_PEP_ID=MMETSP0092-20131115/6041_1 /ASSEMBLY_ACC=CAM_ASM_001090 /TAXON_ID=426623 /ORGANISM="Chaetoceros affinis, Strain CCMP159" /LENGTH=219 /DNA_ID=CAMNT_0050603305 /DNA_START=53 /DNA_END=709 /DNA_ORIENTATION=+